MTERQLLMELTIFIRENYPDVPYRVDVAADIPLAPIHKGRVKALHGKWSRGYPDLFIASCQKGYCGLFLELKTEQAGIANTEHTRTQKAYHEVLRNQGYKVKFCCGLEKCKKQIKKYLKENR